MFVFRLLNDLVAKGRINHQFLRDLDGVRVYKDGDYAGDHYRPNLHPVLVPSGYAIHGSVEPALELLLDLLHRVGTVSKKSLERLLDITIREIVEGCFDLL